MKLRLDHVQLAIPPGGEQAARTFWGELLGLSEIEKPPELSKRGGCWFALGEHQLHLGIEDPFQPALKAHPAFRASNIGALAKRLAHVTWDDTIAGTLRFFTADPFGNRLEFIETS